MKKLLLLSTALMLLSFGAFAQDVGESTAPPSSGADLCATERNGSEDAPVARPVETPVSPAAITESP